MDYRLTTAAATPQSVWRPAAAPRPHHFELKLSHKASTAWMWAAYSAVLSVISGQIAAKMMPHVFAMPSDILPYLPMPNGGDGFPLLAAIASFAAAIYAIILAFRALKAAPVLALDQLGFTDHRTSKTIRWVEVQKASPISGNNGVWGVWIELKHGARTVRIDTTMLSQPSDVVAGLILKLAKDAGAQIEYPSAFSLAGMLGNLRP